MAQLCVGFENVIQCVCVIHVYEQDLSHLDKRRKTETKDAFSCTLSGFALCLRSETETEGDIWCLSVVSAGWIVALKIPALLAVRRRALGKRMA